MEVAATPVSCPPRSIAAPNSDVWGWPWGCWQPGEKPLELVFLVQGERAQAHGNGDLGFSFVPMI